MVPETLTVLIERSGTATTRLYTRGSDKGGGIVGLIAQNTTGTNAAVVYYQYDDLGSSSNLTSSSGSLASSYSYDPFGNLLFSKSSSDTNRYLFSTKEFDPRSGLYYFGARYYDPEVGRWLTPDPMGFVDGMNLYAYVNNNPINLIDPYGYIGERIGNLFKDIDWVSLTDAQREELHEAIIMASLGPAGAGQKAPIVIGETMTRVINKAKSIGADYYKARKLPSQIGMDKALRNNYQWFRRMYAQGREIIDLKTFSPFLINYMLSIELCQNCAGLNR